MYEKLIMYAFKSCKAIENIYIPDQVEVIDGCAFSE